jgi:hypothetical protein
VLKRLNAQLADPASPLRTAGAFSDGLLDGQVRLRLYLIQHLRTVVIPMVN